MPKALFGVGPRSDEGPIEWTYVRDISDDEYERLTYSIQYCRKCLNRLSALMVVNAANNFDRILQSVLVYDESSDARLSISRLHELTASLVSFLQSWRSFIDQSKHDLSRRFGDGSEAYEGFVLKASQLFDSNRGYKVIEGLRNFVTHEGNPTLNVQQRGRLPKDGQGEPTTEVTVSMTRTRILQSKKITRHFRNALESYPTDEIPISEVLDEAMSGFYCLADHLIEIDAPELVIHLESLLNVVRETAPDWPLLANFPQRSDMSVGAELTIEVQRFDDLFPLLSATQSDEPGRSPRDGSR